MPEFPSPGGKCVVIDSRISSRKEIVDSIEAQNLFDQIVIATSIINAIQKFRREDFEACLIGTSISDEIATSFIKEAKELKSGCAFVAIRETRAEAEKLEGIMDSVLAGEVTPLKLAVRVSQAMVKASKEPERWKAYFQQSLDALKNFEAHSVNLASSSTPREHEKAINISTTSTRVTQDTDLTRILEKLTKGLFQLQEGYASREFDLDAFAIPSASTVRAIKQISHNIFDHEAENVGTVELRRTFEKFLIQWFVDMVATNPEQATRKLRVKLVQELR